MKLVFIFALLLTLVCCQNTYIQFGSDLATDLATRLTTLLNTSSPYPVITLPANQTINYSSLPSQSIVISFGNTTQTNNLITNAENLPAEGYIIASQANGTIYQLAATGKGLPNNKPFKVYANIGLHYACYQLLIQLGYSFLHPLQPIIPTTFIVPPPQFYIASAPEWPIRTWHYHTEHPLELTEFLNGMNSGNETWESMIDEFELVTEWLIANRQNRFEWVLLWTKPATEEAFSPLRQQRLSIITSILHTYGIAAGADVPIAEKQQHAWYMTGQRYTTEQQKQNISNHVDWLMAANYDFISTESGYSEFTHPNCTLMLFWMNFTAEYLTSNYPGKRIYIKCHCSSGQVCQDYLDPYTGEPLNFNFLPAYATPEMGIYPHTVQIYTLFEPAPTYGNQNFTYMLEFLVEQTGHREVAFHGETAYWVNYDIDVPLFLSAVYGANRLSDMRSVYNYTTGQNRQPAQGQVDFCSGWEWAYWLGDVITASASWEPYITSSDEQALYSTLVQILRNIAPPNTVTTIVNLLIEIIDIENQLLVYGNWNGTNPSSVVRRNGIAYIEGWDTWSEWTGIVDPTDATQPAKLTFHNIRDPVSFFNHTDYPDYQTEIEPLLFNLQGNFSYYLATFAQQRANIYQDALPFFDEIVDTLNITLLRSQEVYYLYQYVWGALHKTPSWRKQQIEMVNQILVQVQDVVARREANYRVPVERIAGWRENPTSYHYGYLWTVHSMYYFWRDYSQATNISVETITPCFMNIITPIDIVFGPGAVLNASLEIGEWLDTHGLAALGECMSAPAAEPVYPFTPIIDTPEKFEKVLSEEKKNQPLLAKYLTGLHSYVDSLEEEGDWIIS